MLLLEFLKKKSYMKRDSKIFDNDKRKQIKEGTEKINAIKYTLKAM